MKDSEVKEFMSEIRKRLLDFHCPRWEEMPDVELYADLKNPELEDTVETVLDRHGIFYEKSEVWIESEGLYEVLYTFEIGG